MNETCALCGSAMRQTYAYLTFDVGCQQVPLGLVCTSPECLEQQREQDRADAERRSEEALARAIESGLILP